MTDVEEVTRELQEYLDRAIAELDALRELEHVARNLASSAGVMMMLGELRADELRFALAAIDRAREEASHG